jgi:hypothetical protein
MDSNHEPNARDRSSAARSKHRCDLDELALGLLLDLAFEPPVECVRTAMRAFALKHPSRTDGSNAA